MKSLSTISIMTAGMLLAASSFAQAPAGAPAGSTGQCKDGSYYSGATKQGACRGHHGVKDWYGAAPAASPLIRPLFRALSKRSQEGSFGQPLEGTFSR